MATPLLEHFEEFKEKYLRSGKSEVTVRSVKDALKFIVRNTVIKTIEDCNDSILLEDTLYEMKDERNWSGVTLNSYLKNLNTYFIWLKKRKYIKENDLGSIQRCTEEQKEQYTLSEEQVMKVIAQVHMRQQTRLQRYRNVFFIDLLRFTGARPCELLNVEMQHIIKAKDGTYKIIIKGRKQKGRPRYYPCPSWLRDSFETYRDHRAKLRENENFLFISSSKTSKWTEKGMRGLFRRLSEELGFRVTAYGFRRFVATYLNKQGLSLKEIGRHLGHTRESTTRTYIERSCCLTDATSRAMDEFMKNNDNDSNL
ncbi:site-specific integrase [Candidatus Peregrinibacteria bacterium]|jgi:site-specific recombinase XerD|nr:site-specific integrase [Candidatus Peregrinibacteria bacterium]